MGFVGNYGPVLPFFYLKSNLCPQVRVCCTNEDTKLAKGSHRIISNVDAIQYLPSPVYLKGLVEHGFGRGSRKLGTPTANLPATVLRDGELSLDGVYFGFARVPGLDDASRKAVLNCGFAKTFGDVKKRVIEAYIIHEYKKDFYGLEMRLCVLGFMRPEIRFKGIGELKATISNDVEVAKRVLDTEKVRKFTNDPFLLHD